MAWSPPVYYAKSQMSINKTAKYSRTAIVESQDFTEEQSLGLAVDVGAAGDDPVEVAFGEELGAADGREVEFEIIDGVDEELDEAEVDVAESVGTDAVGEETVGDADADEAEIDGELGGGGDDPPLVPIMLLIAPAKLSFATNETYH